MHCRFSKSISPLLELGERGLQRRFTLFGCPSANNVHVQVEHYCLQVYSWGSSILSDEFMCSCRYSRRYLRSATHGDLLVPRTRTVTYGPRSFAVSGPTVWNTLPSTPRVSTTTLGQFQSGVKTILFRLAYGT